MERDGIVDPHSLSGVVWIYRANYDPTMRWHSAVKRDEMFSVDRQNSTLPGCSIGKHGLICDALIGVPGFQGGHYFVPEFPKLHDRQ